MGCRFPGADSTEEFWEAIRQIISAFPQHVSEHRRLNSTGSELADCLSGSVDPLPLLFRSKADKDLLTEVHTNSPMFATRTRILSKFLVKTLSKYYGPEKLRVLELGAGTGGITKRIVDLLLSHAIELTYTSMDLSSSMVAAVKKKFDHYSSVKFIILGMKKELSKQLLHSQHVILFFNCIHAIKNLLNASMNVYNMLKQRFSVLVRID